MHIHNKILDFELCLFNSVDQIRMYFKMFAVLELWLKAFHIYTTVQNREKNGYKIKIRKI